MMERVREAKSLASSNPELALSICNEVLNEEPETEAGELALFLTGYILLDSGKDGLAYHVFRRCAEMRPNRSEIWSNMGMAIENIDRDKALKIFDKALEKDSSNASALANKGLMYLQTGRPQRAIEYSNRALKIDPNLNSALHNRGLAKLMLRDWSGWDEYYMTQGVKERVKRDYGAPEWEGQEGTVVVYGEQGVGDEIMFATCVPDLLETNNVILEVDKRTHSIFDRSFSCPVYGNRFSDKTELVDEHKFDYQISMGQLPYFFRRDHNSFPGNPILTPDPERVKQWSSLLDGDKPVVGFSMMGGSKETGMKYRTTTLETFLPLTENYQLVCLDYKEVDAKELEKHGIKYWPRAVKKGSDLEELLALVSCLDAVVTVCNTVVYFAGAVGVPCHVLVPEYAGYRYHSEGESFPWFNSVKLHRGDFKRSVKDINENIYRIRQKGNGSLSRSMQQYNEAFIEAV